MMDTWHAAKDYFFKTHKDALARAQKTSTGSTTVTSQFKYVIRETKAAAGGGKVGEQGRIQGEGSFWPANKEEVPPFTRGLAQARVLVICTLISSFKLLFPLFQPSS